MKTKLKYDEGRFLENDRKDNEIIILRRENSNLKKSIEKLEEKAFSFKKEIENNKNEINNLQNEIKKLNIKIEDLQKQNENLKANNINININNITGTNTKNEILPNNNICNLAFKEENFFKKNNYPNKIFPYQKIKSKFLNIKKHNVDIMNNTRNESLEKVKSDMMNKYFIGGKIYRNNSLINNSFKTNHFIYGHNYLGNNINQNNSQIQNFKSRLNNNIIKKVISPSKENNIRSNSSKVKENNKFNFING
jgi:peptidoglycan hydrolase CwlO-like protein